MRPSSSACHQRPGCSGPSIGSSGARSPEFLHGVARELQVADARSARAARPCAAARARNSSGSGRLLPHLRQERRAHARRTRARRRRRRGAARASASPSLGAGERLARREHRDLDLRGASRSSARHRREARIAKAAASALCATSSPSGRCGSSVPMQPRSSPSSRAA